MYLETEVRFLNSQTPDIAPQYEGPVDLASLPSTDMSAACSGELCFLMASFISLMIPFADPKCPSRYHCTHEAGVHSVGLTWIHKLHRFLGSGEFFTFQYVSQILSKSSLEQKNYRENK